MAIARVHEREVTFDVGSTWTLPELSELVPDGGRLARATHVLEAVYYDTEPALLRPLGITLRHRAGGADAGWHLKLPAGDGRTEVHSHAAPSSVPAALARRLTGVTAGRRVSPVATMSTTRHTAQVLDADGTLVLEVADDHVAGSRTGADPGRVAWREVEIELGPAGAEDHLQAAAALLERAGARVAGQQRKINHVLGEPPGLGTTGRPGLVATYLQAQCRAVLLGDARMRDDPAAEPVHRTRVAVRRLRSTLRTYGHVLAPAPAEVDRLDAELRWLGGLLSPVRDSDVLGVRLRHELGRLAPRDVVGPVGRETTRALATERAVGLAAWRGVRDGERYQRLMTLLGDWFATSPVNQDAGVHPRRVLRKANRRVRCRLSRAENATGLHDARKAAKRLRYAAEALAPGMGEAKRVAQRAKKRQSAWGEHQDLAVAAAFLRRVADPGHRPAVRSGFTYGVLVARMEQDARQIRRRAGAAR